MVRRGRRHGRGPDPLEEEAIGLFRDHFGCAPTVVASAPGRVNLIGEQIDFLGGSVLPTAVDRLVAMAVREAPDWSLRSGEPGRGLEMLRALGAELGMGPFQAAVASTLPTGLGLSSSAALLVAFAAALAPDLDPLQVAVACQRAEQTATGVLCGVMDPVASALGRRGCALWLNCRTLQHRWIALPARVAIVVVDSGVSRDLASTPYNRYRGEVESALRDSGQTLEQLLVLPAGSGPRLRHAMTEQARVAEFVEALGRGDASAMGDILVRSHASLRDDYGCSLPIVDDLVERALTLPGCLGARIMGGGFGGSVLALLESGREDRFLSLLGRPGIVCRTADGAFAG